MKRIGVKPRESRLRWYGNVLRRAEDCVGGKVTVMSSKRRKRGRPWIGFMPR